jgi:hypothetical protein
MDLISAFNFGMQKLPPLQKLPTAFTDWVPYIFNELIIARFSWIHLDDLVNLIYESLTNPAYKGDLKSTTAHSLIPPFLIYYLNCTFNQLQSYTIGGILLKMSYFCVKWFRMHRNQKQYLVVVVGVSTHQWNALFILHLILCYYTYIYIYILRIALVSLC